MSTTHATSGSGTGSRTPPTPRDPSRESTQPRDIDSLLGEIWGAGLAGEDGTATLGRRRGVEVADVSTRLSLRHRVLSGGDVRRDGDPHLNSDFELLDVLGKGGMGVVYSARQAAFDREVAVKLIRSDHRDRHEARERFLAEAAVTGQLEHPGVVPVIDLGVADDGTLFYAMKQVVGMPWDRCIADVGLAENLRILRQVVETVAFAHARGVLHRDLKPDNVVVGDYGEVVLMDWGLAVSLAPDGHGEPLHRANACAGTPAYMAPEMALGRIERIDERTDVYLLGAILFEIVTGEPPHDFGGNTRCLRAAARNRCRSYAVDGELIRIARQAMTTEPEDRFADAHAFGTALIAYQEHQESIVLSERAERELAKAEDHGDYDGLARAVFGFEEAIALWAENDRALAGRARARLVFARTALGRGDLGLAERQLLPDAPSHARALARLGRARAWRRSRARITRALAGSTAGLLLLVAIGGTVLYSQVRSELNRRLELEDREAERLADLARQADAARQKGHLALHQAAGATGEGRREELLLTAQRHLREALFLRSDDAKARELMREASLDHFHLSLARDDFNQAREKLHQAHLVAPERVDRERLEAELERRAGERRRRIDRRVDFFVAELAKPRPALRPAMMRRELIALTDPHTVDRLIPLLGHEETEVRLLAAESLGWMRDGRAVDALIACAAIEGPDGRSNPVPLQAAAIRSLAVLAGDRPAVVAAIRARLRAEEDYLDSRLGLAVLPFLRQYARRALPHDLEVDDDDLGLRGLGAKDLHRRALLRFELGDRDRAAELVTRALQANPRFPAALELRAMLEAAAGNLEAARFSLGRAIRIRDDYAPFHLRRARISLRLGDFGAALEDAHRAVALDPDSAWAHAVLGDVLRESGRPAEAIAAFDRALHLEPDLVLATARRAEVFADLGEIRRALDAAREAVRRFPQHPTPWRSLAAVALADGRTGAALAHLDRAVGCDFGDPVSRLRRGRLLLRTGRPDEALEDLDRAVAVAGAGPQALYWRSRTRAALGDREGARADARGARKARRNDPRFEAWWEELGGG